MSASILLWKIRIMDFSKNVAVCLSQGVIVFYLAEKMPAQSFLNKDVKDDSKCGNERITKMIICLKERFIHILHTLQGFLPLK